MQLERKQGELRWGFCDRGLRVLCSKALCWKSRAGQGKVCVQFVVECQETETSSSFPGALSCPLRLLAFQVGSFYEKSLELQKESESANSWFVADKFLFSVEVKPLDFAKTPFFMDQKKAKHHFSLDLVPRVFGNSVII